MSIPRSLFWPPASVDMMRFQLALEQPGPPMLSKWRVNKELMMSTAYMYVRCWGRFLCELRLKSLRPGHRTIEEVFPSL